MQRENFKKSSELWGIILAGGDGARLSSLTRQITGDERPKQFCPLLNNETMLAQTRKRVAQKIAPEKVLFVLTRKHEPFYAPLLQDVPKERLIIQPENKGTTAALLYALLKLSLLAPDATAAIFPSDHYVADETTFMRYIGFAFQETKSKSDHIILLGIEPDKAENEYGWIEEKSGTDRSIKEVFRFWEKPSPQKAKNLLRKGCLWNSFVMVGKVSSFLNLIAQTQPNFYNMFASIRYTMNTVVEKPILYDIYREIAPINFSSEVLEKNPGALMVMRVKNVGWSDWGKPQRVMHTLNALGFTPHWTTAA